MRILFIPIFLVSTLSPGQSNVFQKAEEHYVLGRLSDARELISNKIDKNSAPEDYLLRALIHERLDMRSNAHEDFVSAISADPDYHEAYFLFAQFLTDSHDYERAVASLNMLLDQIESSETQGIFFRIDRLGEKRLQVESMVTMEADILMARGMAYQGLKLNEKSMTDFNAAIFINPTADKYVNRADLFKKMGKIDEAKEDLHAAVELDPKYGLAWYNLFVLDHEVTLPKFLKSNDEFVPMLSARAVEAVENGDYVLARKLYAQALRLSPDDPVLLLNAGRLDFRNGFLRGALDKFVKARKVSPDKTEALYLIGNVHFGRKDYHGAIDYYEKYLRTDPNYGLIWFNTAMAYMELDQIDDACKCLNRANALNMKKAEEFIQTHCSNE